MDVNKLLDTIQGGLQDIEEQILKNLNSEAKAQRTKPVDVRLRELESLVARLKWDVYSIKNHISLYDMRIASSRDDAAKALAEVRELAGASTQESRRKRR